MNEQDFQPDIEPEAEDTSAAPPDVEPESGETQSAPGEVQPEAEEQEIVPSDGTEPAEPAETEEPAPTEESPAESGAKAEVTEVLRRQVEALLFVSEQPISPHRIATVLKVAEGLVKAAIRDLAADYDIQGRAFGISEIAGGYQVLSRPEYGELVAGLYEHNQQSRLSQAALETLAIVAYKQPVMRVEIEDIRGVGVQPVLRSLLDAGLVRVVGRSEALGRPLLYGTTKKFLVTFGLKSPKDLPSTEDLKSAD